MVSRRQIEAYLADAALRTANAPLEEQEEMTAMLVASMRMARVLLDADAVEVNGDWTVTIKGGTD